jgi:thioredoxin reductase (NADPH)
MHDLVIVGSGPAGFTAAIYAARAQLKPLLIASSIAVGGELMKTTEVENFPGFPEGIQGPELMANLQAQAERFGTEILYDDVVELDLSGDVKIVKTAEGGTFETKSVIISTGAQYRTLGLDRELELSGHGVSWCATCDGFFFRDKIVAVVGGGDSALEEADFLTKFATKVYVIHRKDTFKASKAMQQRIFDNPKIEILWNQAVSTIHGTDSLTAVTLVNTADGSVSELPIHGLFIAIGSDPRSELVADQLELDENKFIKVQGRSSKTNISGVFACGDVIDPTYRQAITAAGSGCVAALDAEHYLNSL